MVGTTLSHYKIEDRIGEGGMGVVYRATDTRLGRVVVIKVIAADGVGDRDRRTAFSGRPGPHRRSTTRTSSRSTKWIRSTGSTSSSWSCVEGRPLNEIIPGAGLPMERAIELAEQIANALAVAHASGIVHRDIKPANIVISDRGQAKMLDFGLAKALVPLKPAADTMTAAFATELGVVVGTIA